MQAKITCADDFCEFVKEHGHAAPSDARAVMMCSGLSLWNYVFPPSHADLSLPRNPCLLRGLNLRRGVVGCQGMFVLLASLLFSLRRCLQTRAALHAENLALRHQLLLLPRVHQNRRLRLRSCDRLVWVWLSRVWPNWRSALCILKPETRHRLAPPRLSAVLEMEKQRSSWSTVGADRSPKPDPINEFRSSTLGRTSPSW